MDTAGNHTFGTPVKELYVFVDEHNPDHNVIEHSVGDGVVFSFYDNDVVIDPAEYYKNAGYYNTDNACKTASEVMTALKFANKASGSYSVTVTGDDSNIEVYVNGMVYTYVTEHKAWFFYNHGFESLKQAILYSYECAMNNVQALID